MDRQEQVDGHPEVWKGGDCGLAGGFVASWTMNVFHTAMSSLGVTMAPEAKARESHAGDDATVKVASELSKLVADHPLTPTEKEVAGPAVHMHSDRRWVCFMAQPRNLRRGRRPAGH